MLLFGIFLLLRPLFLLLFCVEYWFFEICQRHFCLLDGICDGILMAYSYCYRTMPPHTHTHTHRWEKRKFAVRQNGLFICKVICSPNVIVVVVVVCRCRVNVVVNGTPGMRWWKRKNMLFMGCISLFLYIYMSFSRKREFYTRWFCRLLFSFFFIMESYLKWVLCNVLATSVCVQGIFVVLLHRETGEFCI